MNSLVSRRSRFITVALMSCLGLSLVSIPTGSAQVSVAGTTSAGTAAAPLPVADLEPGAVNGDAPARGYVVGREWHRSGTTVTMPHDYAEVGAVGGHLIGARDYRGNGIATVDVLDSTGAVVFTSRLRWQFVVSDDHTVAAWIGPRGRTHTWTELDGDVPLALQRPGAHARDVNGSSSCRPEAPGNCVVFFDFADKSWSTDSAGVTKVVAADSLKFADATDGGKLAYLTSVRAAGSCSRIRPGFRTCRHSFDRFADDGKRIIGYDDYRDGIGDRFADMVSSSADRAELRVRVPRNGYIAQVLWEDNDTWVVNAWVAGQAQLYRVNSDASWQRIAPAVESADIDNPYQLVK